MQWLQKHYKKINYFVTYFLGPILFVWLSFSIYREIKAQKDIHAVWQHIREQIGGPSVWKLITVFVLMIVNWSVEAVKWKLAIEQLQKIKFLHAFKAVISGVSFSVSTPNRVGEYLGRILYMKEGNRLKAISLTIACSISQLIITLLMGCFGFILIQKKIVADGLLTPLWSQVIGWGVAIATFILTLFYFRLSWLVKWIHRLPGSDRFIWIIQTLEGLNATKLWRILSLSAIRFGIFILQYYLLYSFFEVHISWWQAWWSVSVCFLIMAIIPTIALFTDLGLRGKVNLLITGLFSQNQLGIGLVAVTIWLINLIIPALTGSLLILGIKRSSKNQVEEARLK